MIVVCRLPMGWKLPRRIRWRVRRKEGSDRIQSGGGCRHDVEGPTWVPREPGLDLRMLIGGVVVDDSLNNPARWHCALDGIEKANELLMAEDRDRAAPKGAPLSRSSTQYGNLEVNLRDAIVKIAEGHLINRIAEPNTMATINRILIQLLSSDAHARGSAYHPAGAARLIRPACQAAISDAMLTKALMPRCLEPVVGPHGEVAKDRKSVV